MADQWTEQEIARVREETEGCNPDRVFLNNAGASLPPRRVVERVIQHLRREEQVGAYEAANEVADQHEGVYISVAEMLGADPDEVALMESATRAWQMAFYSVPLQRGDRILTAENEYASNYIGFLQVAKQRGAEIVVLPSVPTGEVDLEALEIELRAGGVGLIALTHIATNNGLVQPAKEVGRLAQHYGVPFLLDACQAVGQVRLNVHELGCDMLSATGRKHLRAPRGTGFLWIRRELYQHIEPAMLDMKSATWIDRDHYQICENARRFECWESSIAGRLGLGEAVRYAMEIGLDRIETRVQFLAGKLRGGLKQIEGIQVQDRGKVQSGIVTFTSERMASQELVRKLAEQGIAVRTSPIEATRLDMERRNLSEVIRASVHYFNTETELERVCRVLGRLMETAQPA